MRDLSALVFPLAAPALQIVGATAPSRTYLGGSPDLPTGIDWPTRDGVPLTFLARLSLDEIQAMLSVPWLPASGDLLFFYDGTNQPWGFDPHDKGSWAVLHLAGLPAHGMTDSPAVLPGELLPRRPAGFRRIDVLPSFENEAVRGLKFSNEELDEYIDLIETRYFQGPKHQVVGVPNPIQGDTMDMECQLASHGVDCGRGFAAAFQDPGVEALKPGAADWRLLLQFDTDDDLGLMWGDCGRLYFWIREQDARAGDFSNCWLILQCG